MSEQFDNNKNEPEEMEKNTQKNDNSNEYVSVNIDKVEEVKKNKEKKGLLKEVIDWVVSIGIAVLAVTIINMFVFVQVMVDGSSMVPTLHDGDRLFASRFLYEPEVGDIVVVEPYLTQGTVKGKLMFGRTLYIKRVIAVGGDTVDIKDNHVYVNGSLKEEEYIADDVKTIKGSLSVPVNVPDGHVFVMGDNREHSRDSRDQTVGILRNEQVVGTAKFRIYPFSDFGVVK